MRTWKRIAVMTTLALAALGALAAGVLVYSGWYDVSATNQHLATTYRLLDVAMRRSIALRAADTVVPPLDDPARAVNGFRHFRAHCVQCHGAPGIAPQPFALGMTPAPAALVATAREWPAADVYWAIRHGIKMTGMPAWQYRMSDNEIWDVVAFLKVLPTLSPAAYRAWDVRYPPMPAAMPPSAPGQIENARLGDARAGRRALQQYLCATCHTIPGIAGADRRVGPPLGGFADRQYIAGVLPNTPANLMHWLRHPTQVDPLSAMPDLGVTELDARDMAAFLYTLGGDR